MFSRHPLCMMEAGGIAQDGFTIYSNGSIEETMVGAGMDDDRTEHFLFEREISGQFDRIRLVDRRRLERDLKQYRAQLRRGEAAPSLREAIVRRLQQAVERNLGQYADRLPVAYPPELPLTAKVAEIKEALECSPVVIVCGSTGSGKTTQLPKIALELGRGRAGRIGCTQPRRLAATAMARRVAAELQVELGREVGSQVRFDDRTGEATVIKFMTDGILLAETRHDPDLLQYDTLIIDEVHERSLNIDFILGYLKDLLRRRRDLKVVISSATLDAGHFSDFFNRAPVVTVEGRTYPVEDCFLPPEEDEELSGQVARAVEFVSELDRSGDILVFLPGEREIRDAVDVLSGRRYPNTEVLPLYARLSMGDQQKIFSPGRQRRIILATNVAETSVTIPRIHYVVDSGLARISRYNPRTQIQELQIEQISQASARQRRGRCGRVGEGICVYLYSEEVLQRSVPYTDPEIRRTSLAGVILQMALLGLPRIEKFPFLDPPPANLIRDGVRTLEDIGAIDDHGRITRNGWTIAGLPIDPQLARMILEAEKRKVLPEMIVIVAFLSILDPRERPADQQQAADQAHRQWRDERSDFLGILKLWNFLQQELRGGLSYGGLRRLCRRNFLNYNRIREWFNLVGDLTDAVRECRWKAAAEKVVFERISADLIHLSILAGIPRNVGCFDREYLYYRGTGGRKFYLFPGSALFKQKPVPAWIVTFALVETTRIYARQNAVIKPEFIEQAAPHLCTPVYSNVQFDPASGFVYAREQVTFGGLLVHNGRRVHYGKLRPAEAREVFLREGLLTGDYHSDHRVLKRHRRLLERLNALEIKVRRPGTILDTEAMYEHLAGLLGPEICSIKALEEALDADPELARRLVMPDAAAMQVQLRPVLPEEYPDEMTFAGHRFRLRYAFEPGEKEDGVLLLVPTAELNLLDAAALEYGVPGYLPEKVELLLKSLPKELRQRCMPLAGCAREYIAVWRQGKLRPGAGLLTTLSEFLEARVGRPVLEREFSPERLPQYLTLRVAELNREGRVVAIHDEVPAAARCGSRLSAAVAGVGMWVLSGCDDWPGAAMPESVSLPPDAERLAYPAVVDEETAVGRQLFLDLAEAQEMHRAGIVRLFKLQQANLIKFIRRDFKLPPALRLDFFAADPGKNYLDDLLDWSISTAFGGRDLWSIRSGEAYRTRRELARERLGAAAMKHQEMLVALHEQYAPLMALIRKMERTTPGVCRDLLRQLKFLFRPGFLRCEVALERYPRYLRGAWLRAGRINSAPHKDDAKLEPLEPLIERFHLAALGVEHPERSPQLVCFFLALQELRLAQFAPEVRTLEKVSVQKLQALWDELRL